MVLSKGRDAVIDLMLVEQSNLKALKENMMFEIIKL